MRASDRALLALLLAAPLAGCFGNGVERDDARIALEPYLEGLDDPIFMADAGDGRGRTFVVEQGGRIRVFNGTSEGPLFLDISSKVSCCNERGLLGLAFHPQYASSGRFYVYYTDTSGDVVVAEYRATQDRNRAEPVTAREIMREAHREHANHNGGMLAFGPDGMLYLAPGDGGGARDPDGNGQDLDTLLGKMLRIDVGSRCGNLAYCIPADNPFVGRSGRDEIWHYGLRNPWRFSFDRDTGDLWIGDVGQGSLEEIDFVPAGEGGVNFGWSRFEGTSLHNPGRSANDAVPPVAEYRNEPPHCAVTGGYRYRGTAIPDLQGAYVFGDYCSGTIWTLRRDGGDWTMRHAVDTSLFISSFAEDADGELYAVDRGGSIQRIVAA